MGKVFCLMGKSSSGKDTMFKLLKGDKTLNLQTIVPYTTRPQRNNETNGVEYFFIDERMLWEFDRLGNVIEKRGYETVNGMWYYCTIDDGRIDLARKNYLLITTLEAYKNIKNYFGAENVVPIYLYLDDGERLERALAREKQQQNPNYDELCRRFLADNIDFSKEQLDGNGVHIQYLNDDLKTCLTHIKMDIMN